MTLINKISKSLTSILSNLNNFHSLQFVDCVIETQFQGGENSNYIIWADHVNNRFKAVLLADLISLLLGTECVFKHQVLQIFGLKLNRYESFEVVGHPLEVVGRGCETQLHVGKK